MTDRAARHSLVIFSQGEEVPGLIFYGLSRPDEAPSIDPTLVTGFGSARAHDFVLVGDRWRVFGREVPITDWGDADRLRDAIRGVLLLLVKAGCRVAWVGAEGLPFADPPHLFDPAYMTGAVLASLTDDGQFVCRLDPDAPLAPFSSAELLALRSHARGLADVE